MTRSKNCLFIAILVEFGRDQQQIKLHKFMFCGWLRCCLSSSLLLYRWLSLLFFPQKKCDAVFMFTQSLVVNPVSLHFCSRLTIVSLVSLFSLLPAASLRRSFGGRGRCGLCDLISRSEYCVSRPPVHSHALLARNALRKQRRNGSRRDAA